MLEGRENKYRGATCAVAALLVVAGLGATKVANAALLVAGSNFTTPTPESIPAGVVIQNQTENFTGTNGSATVFTGTIQSEVIVDSTSGDDDFVYQINNNPNSADSIERLSLDSFASFTLDVGYVSGNTDPSYADRSIDGSIVGFNFLASDEIAPNTSSDFLVVKTNSSSWVEGNGALIDGGTGNADVTVPTFISTMGVPEPGTVALLMMTGGGLLLRRRRS
jgi:hypothetical protein